MTIKADIGKQYIATYTNKIISKDLAHVSIEYGNKNGKLPEKLAVLILWKCLCVNNAEPHKVIGTIVAITSHLP